MTKKHAFLTKKEVLLEAAGLIVIEKGVHNITLEAVAKKADVSKGGLLHHFPSKDILLSELAQYYIQKFDVLIDEQKVIEGDERGAWLRAYVTVCTTSQHDMNTVNSVLIAIWSSGSQFVEPIRRAYENWRKKAENDGVPPDVALLICMAADGCWLYSLYPKEAQEGAQNQLLALRQKMLSLIDEAVNPST